MMKINKSALPIVALLFTLADAGRWDCITREGRKNPAIRENPFNLGARVDVTTKDYNIQTGEVYETHGPHYAEVKFEGDFELADGRTYMCRTDQMELERQRRRRMMGRWDCITREGRKNPAIRENPFNLGWIVNVTTKDYGIQQGEICETHGPHYAEVRFEGDFELADGRSYMCRTDKMVFVGYPVYPQSQRRRMMGRWECITPEGRKNSAIRKNPFNLGNEANVRTKDYGIQKGTVVETHGPHYAEVKFVGNFKLADDKSYICRTDQMKHI
jgi:hypothetical protein